MESQIDIDVMNMIRSTRKEIEITEFNKKTCELPIFKKLQIEFSDRLDKGESYIPHMLGNKALPSESLTREYLANNK
ncbi:MAG: hypothetical protein WCK31_00880 [bacterium]